MNEDMEKANQAIQQQNIFIEEVIKKTLDAIIKLQENCDKIRTFLNEKTKETKNPTAQKMFFRTQNNLNMAQVRIFDVQTRLEKDASNPNLLELLFAEPEPEPVK
jgi:BioD-like phosphotransacetylase family protein